MYLVRLILMCTDAVNDFLGKNCQYIAGAIAFYTLFSMFPLVLAMVSIWGFFFPHEMERELMAEQMAEIFPVSSDFIGDTMRGVVSARTITGVAAVFALIWASSTAFGAIRKGINAAWGVTRTRPFIRERLIDLSLATGAGILMVFLLFVTPMVGTVQLLVETAFPDVTYDFIANMITVVASPIITFGTLLMLYKYLPNTEVSFRDVWMGALVASLAIDGATWGFIWYVNTFPVYNVVYGSIGAIMALLTWVYVSAIILLFGALATSRYAEYAEHLGGEVHGLNLLWAGLTRVRLKVVESSEVGV